MTSRKTAAAPAKAAAPVGNVSSVEQTSADQDAEQTTEVVSKTEAAPESTDQVQPDSDTQAPVAQGDGTADCVANITRLEHALALPVVDEAEALPMTYVEGSIEQFKGPDRRTMRVVRTANGLAAIAVEDHA